MDGAAASRTEGKESVVEGLQWVEKNTFLDIAPTAGAGEPLAPVSRQHSAPPSVSYSTSSNSCSVSDDTAGATDEDDDPAEGSAQLEQGGAGGGERPHRHNRRPCKAKRDRYRFLAEECEQLIIAYPGMDIASLALPPWVVANATLERKLRARLERFQASINGIGQPATAAGQVAPKRRAVSPAAGEPRAKARVGLGARQSSASASASTSAFASSSGQLPTQGGPRSSGSQRVLMSL